MRKQYFLILLLMAGFFLSGCTTKTTDTGGVTVTEEKPPEKKKQEKLITTETVAENDVKTLITQAKEFIENNNQKKAIAYLQKAKSLKPDTLVVRELLVSVYKEMGKTNYELNELKELIALKPDNNYRIRYARLLREKKAYDKAINTIEDIRAVDPENIAAILELGIIYKEKKMYNEAIETFKEITYIDEKNALAKYYLAEIYLAQNKLLWADKYYKDALKRDPSLGLAELGLAKIAKRRKDNASYHRHMERAFDLNPENPEIRKEYLK